jgi:DNA-binding transcriptional LysR family regulator
MTRTFEPVHLGSIEIFIKAAETLSFAKAAAELGLSPPAISRSIARLEQRLGTQLFARSTRQVKLTDDGQLYFERCRSALHQIADTENLLGGRQNTPEGLLRISVPTTYAYYRILPILPIFAELYPNIQIELNISNRNIDFIEEGYDLAIRLGELPDSQLVSRKLENAALGIFASPAYLKKHSKPIILEDLKHHAIARFELPSSGRPLPWIFKNKKQDVDIQVKSQIMFSEDFLGCVNYAVAGGGLVQAYDFIAEAHVKKGELVEVLQNFRGRSRPFSLLYPSNRHLSPRVRVFIDFVINSLLK